MSLAARKIDIKNHILLKASALGNSHRGFKEVCSDLLNDALKKGVKQQNIVDGTFLCSQTLERMKKLEDTPEGSPYRPNAETCERIFKYFGAEIRFDEVKIKSTYQNQAKF